MGSIFPISSVAAQDHKSCWFSSSPWRLATLRHQRVRPWKTFDVYSIHCFWFGIFVSPCYTLWWGWHWNLTLGRLFQNRSTWTSQCRNISRLHAHSSLGVWHGCLDICVTWFDGWWGQPDPRQQSRQTFARALGKLQRVVWRRKNLAICQRIYFFSK